MSRWSDYSLGAARFGMMIAALEQDDVATFGRMVQGAFTDRARARLVPAFADVGIAAREAGAAGVALSGAGPSIVAVVDAERVDPRPVAATMTAAFARAGLEARGVGGARSRRRPDRRSEDVTPTAPPVTSRRRAIRWPSPARVVARRSRFGSISMRSRDRLPSRARRVALPRAAPVAPAVIARRGRHTGSTAASVSVQHSACASCTSKNEGENPTGSVQGSRHDGRDRDGGRGPGPRGGVRLDRQHRRLDGRLRGAGGACARWC